MANFNFIYVSMSAPTFDESGFKEIDQSPTRSRQEFLSETFSHRLDFYHRKSQYTYMPTPKETWQEGGFSGYIGKATKVIRSLGPDELFAQQADVDWNAAFLVADVRPDRQIVSMEHRTRVGDPKSVLASMLAAKIDQLQDPVSWSINVERMSSTEDFWAAVDQNSGKISRVIFEFSQHNGLSARQKFQVFKDVDNEIKADSNSTTTTYILENKNKSVVPQGDLVEQAAEYAAAGGGKSVLKSGQRKLFDSSQSPKVWHIDEPEMPRKGERIKMIDLITRFLGIDHTK